MLWRGGRNEERNVSSGLMEVMEDDPCLLPSASVVFHGIVCVRSSVSSLEWEPEGWQLSAGVGFAIRLGICLFSHSVLVPMYTYCCASFLLRPFFRGLCWPRRFSSPCQFSVLWAP